MSVLSQKLQHAAAEFQAHNFQQALDGYNDALKFARSTDEAQHVISNILSSKGALESILGKLPQALQSLNSVLRIDPTHFLALIRRSQIYKKQKKLRKASKDLERIFIFCPDMLQVCAYKNEIQNLILKSKQPVPSDESSEEDDVDEEQLLNFSGLKIIDRLSTLGNSTTLIASKSNLNPNKRCSRVSIMGDQTIEYIRPDFDAHVPAPTPVTLQSAILKFAESSDQIQKDFAKEEENIVQPISVKVNKESRSILKNHNSQLFIMPQSKEMRRSLLLGLENNLVHKLKNIEGKVLKAIGQQKAATRKTRQVEFRKSQYQGEYFVQKEDKKPHSISISATLRKSCLKQSTFDLPLFDSVKSKTPRRSKLQSITLDRIDGKMSKKLDSLVQIEDNVKCEESDEGSQHNIFGSKDLIMSIEMRNTLNLTEQESFKVNKIQNLPSKSRSTGGKSILKKSSFALPLFLSSPMKTQSLMLKSANEKLKKSVMFKKGQALI